MICAVFCGRNQHLRCFLRDEIPTARRPDTHLKQPDNNARVALSADITSRGQVRAAAQFIFWTVVKAAIKKNCSCGTINSVNNNSVGVQHYHTSKYHVAHLYNVRLLALLYTLQFRDIKQKMHSSPITRPTAPAASCCR